MCVEQIHFEIEGDSVKGEKHGGPRAARLATSPLLDSFAFASVGVSPDMSKSESILQSLLPLPSLSLLGLTVSSVQSLSSPPCDNMKSESNIEL